MLKPKRRREEAPHSKTSKSTSAMHLRSKVKQENSLLSAQCGQFWQRSQRHL